MRLWTIHPCYIDRQGLIALWREGLLAKKVLEGKTKGYKNHPQLLRFKKYSEPINAINSYLYIIYLEAEKRGYKFDSSKINMIKLEKVINVKKGQLIYEFKHLLKKLEKRNREKFLALCSINPEQIQSHPLFNIYDDNGIEEWEKG